MKKRTLALILAALLALTSLVAVPVGADYTSGDWGYTVSNGKATITKYTGSATNVTIPREIEGYSVTTIGEWAFYNCTSLASVTIPDNVTAIDEGAFAYCTSLTSVTIPNSVGEIGSHIFEGCTALTSITIPDSVTTIGEYAFFGCTSLTGVMIPDSVTTIGNGAFWYCYSLASVTIPDGVTTIGERTFCECTSLTSVTFGNGVKEIMRDAYFSCTSLTSVNISDVAAWCAISFGSNPLKYAHNLYLNGELITDLVIPDGVTQINGGAFNYCTSLKSVTIPDGFTKISEGTFSYCTSLTSVKIPYSVMEIGAGAFYKCDSITAVYYGGSKEQWESLATGGYRINNPGLWNAAKYYNCAFASGDFMYSVDPDGNATIGCYSGSDTSVTIPDKIDGRPVIAVGEYAFKDCTSLASVTIPDSVTTIGYKAFGGCTSLTSVTIPESITTFGADAFEDVDSLETVYFGGSIEQWDSLFEVIYYTANFELLDATKYYNCAFASGDFMYSVDSDGNATIGRYTGSDTSVTIPEEIDGHPVIAVGEYAFKDCTSLETVYYGGSPKQWNAISIENGNDPLLKADIVFAKEDPEVIPGDLNDDGKINSRDVIALMKLVLTPNAEVTAASDLNNDGKVNSRDVIILMKLVLSQA